MRVGGNGIVWCTKREISESQIKGEKKMILNCKSFSRNRNGNITLVLLGVGVFCFAGCKYSYETTKQGFWEKDHLRASIVEDSFRSRGAPLLVTEQLITLIGEPDYKMTPAEFEGRIPKDKPSIENLSYREWHMRELWESYGRCKEDRRGDSKMITGDGWRDSQEFNECLLWVYDESLHFKKPLHSGDWLYSLFCCEPAFWVHIFFVEDSQIVGSHSTSSSKAFFRKEK